MTSTPITVDTDGTAEVIDAEVVADTAAAPVAVPFDQRAAVNQLLTLAVIKERITEIDAEVREQLAAHMEPGDNLAGCLDPADPKGTALGKVGMNNGSVRAKVDDVDAVLAFVDEHFPTEVVTTRQVRPAFLAKLVEGMKEDGHYVHPVTAEVLEVPGIKVETGDPGLAVRKAKTARDVVVAAVAAGRIQMDGTRRAIEAAR